MVTQQSFREPETLGEWTFKFVQEFVPMRTLRAYVRRGIVQQVMLDAGGPSMWAAPKREPALKHVVLPRGKSVFAKLMLQWFRGEEGKA